MRDEASPRDGERNPSTTTKKQGKRVSRHAEGTYTRTGRPFFSWTICFAMLSSSRMPSRVITRPEAFLLGSLFATMPMASRGARAARLHGAVHNAEVGNTARAQVDVARDRRGADEVPVGVQGRKLLARTGLAVLSPRGGDDLAARLQVLGVRSNKVRSRDVLHRHTVATARDTHERGDHNSGLRGLNGRLNNGCSLLLALGRHSWSVLR